MEAERRKYYNGSSKGCKGVDCTHLAQDRAKCEYGNEYSYSNKDGQFNEQRRYYQLLKKGCFMQFVSHYRISKCNVRSFESFTAMFQVEVFWVVTPCSVVVGYPVLYRSLRAEKPTVL